MPPRAIAKELLETCGQREDLMPQSAPSICAKAGCNTLVLSGSRCSKHEYDKGKHTAQDRQANRRYSTNDPKWRLIRKKQLHRQPLCEECQRSGVLVPANVVDHIDGNAFNNDTTNLQSMCWPCHSRKTAQQDHGFGNA